MTAPKFCGIVIFAAARLPGNDMVPDAGVAVTKPLFSLNMKQYHGVWIAEPVDKFTVMAEVDPNMMNAP
jgi:hypothetical protein